MSYAPADVHDLMHEVYLRLLRMPKHEAVRNPQAYLFTVAHHVLYEHRMRQSAAPQAVEISDLLSEVEAYVSHDPLDQLAARQQLEVIDKSLRQLSPRVHATFVLHRRFGFSLQEIAQHFGVSQPMVKKYLAKAVLHCKTCFEGAKS
jgi:RNA polymerase sigma-70 factor (ECF subfamily)